MLHQKLTRQLIQEEEPYISAIQKDKHRFPNHQCVFLPLQRMRLREFLEAYLPREDGRTKLLSSRALMVLVNNILVARNPIYGVGEWAADYAPDLLGLAPAELDYLNDDRVGRALEKLYRADRSSLALAVAADVVKQFRVELDQLHNDCVLPVSLQNFWADRDGGEMRRLRGPGGWGKRTRSAGTGGDVRQVGDRDVPQVASDSW